MDKLRIVVTGGVGFVGSNLCRRLVADGHDVIAVDNLITGSRENVEDLLRGPSFTFLRHDVVESFDLAADRIYHVACPASPPHYQRDPVRTTLTSVQGTYQALRVAERHGARLLLASTSEVYGDPERSPQAEDYRGNVCTTGPRACYDEGKRCAETLVFGFQTLAQSRRAHRSHLQHLRSRHVHRRRARRQQLHHAGAERRMPDRVWRRSADAQPDAIACSPLGAGRRRPALARLAVIVEHDVRIGPNATILKGVRIGAGAFIEAGALVTRNVPAQARIAGNPAQIVGEV